MIKVSVVGAKGRMGSHVVEAVNNAEDTQLALALDAGDDLTQSSPTTPMWWWNSPCRPSAEQCAALIKQGVDVVVGTTGWTDEKLDQVRAALASGPARGPEASSSRRTSPFPRYSPTISQRPAPYFESAEVIELHHPTKVDAPSGTAIHTAQGIAEARKAAGSSGSGRHRNRWRLPRPGGGRHPRARRASAWPQRP